MSDGTGARTTDPPTPDLVVVGGGPTGMYAAALAAHRGLNVLLVEADDRLGGSASRGDGLMWLPEDSEEAHEYVASVGPSRPPLAAAVVQHGASVRQTLADCGVRLQQVPEPDAHDLPGSGRGRIWEPSATDARRLKEHRGELRIVETSITYTDARRMVVSLRHPVFLARTARVLGGRALLSRVAGRQPTVGGSALVVGLMSALLKARVPVWRSSPLVGLVGGESAGVIVRHDEEDVLIRPRLGVLLTAGGFSFDPERRLAHLSSHADPTVSLSAPLNNGSALTAALALGAAEGGYGDAEWRPVIVTVDGERHPVDLVRCLPFSILVDQTGNRFCDEAAPGVEIGRAMLNRARETRDSTAFLVMDDRHRKRYPLGPWPPRLLPNRAVANGELQRADTVIALAGELSVDKAGLVGQVTAFNGYASKGADPDFGRGSSRADRAKGQPLHRKNPSLGALERPPYWGVLVHAADVSTRGGLVTDSAGRVLDRNGGPVPGLFAAGAIAALPWGEREPAPGAGCGASLVAAHASVLTMLTSRDA
ncbi:MAG TPA: FAD-dependent oxidoreductase [Propionibacteriaceae bacterium]|nr:FAD-dependent oxidoreductase [Propionibacteriaceae bacterium]